MQDDFFNDDDTWPLTGEALAEYRSIMQHATIWELKIAASELTELCDDLKPNRFLFDGLSRDQEISRSQLACWVVRERSKRRRLVQLLAG